MSMESAAATPECLELDLHEGEARCWPAAFDADEASRLFDALRTGIHWCTARLVKAGEILGIALLDHVIVAGGGRCHSMADHGEMGGASCDA